MSHLSDGKVLQKITIYSKKSRCKLWILFCRIVEVNEHLLKLISNKRKFVNVIEKLMN